MDHGTLSVPCDVPLVQGAASVLQGCGDQQRHVLVVPGQDVMLPQGVLVSLPVRGLKLFQGVNSIALLSFLLSFTG